MPTPFVADAADEAVCREPKVERPSDAAEEPKVRGVLKSAQVPCEARGANESNQTLEYCALGGRD
jgi:hypothetical protein